MRHIHTSVGVEADEKIGGAIGISAQTAPSLTGGLAEGVGSAPERIHLGLDE
jgi:hypothetical protein